uniref:RanBP2-type domain-containing protein n=1 Tax=Lotharella oceanica TaxID=641309 RepID=A0A7S2TSN9_9EUKA
MDSSSTERQNIVIEDDIADSFVNANHYHGSGNGGGGGGATLMTATVAGTLSKTHDDWTHDDWADTMKATLTALGEGSSRRWKCGVCKSKNRSLHRVCSSCGQRRGSRVPLLDFKGSSMSHQASVRGAGKAEAKSMHGTVSQEDTLEAQNHGVPVDPASAAAAPEDVDEEEEVFEADMWDGLA